jgi:uncharacterized protein with LGFP repeats
MRTIISVTAICVLQFTMSLFAHTAILEDGPRRTLGLNGFPGLCFRAAAGGGGPYAASTSNAQTSARDVAPQFQPKWLKLGGERGRMGRPTSDVTRTRDGGAVQHFEHGGMYWSAATGVQEVSGEIFSKYASMGEERSALGYPTSDTSIPQDKVGRYSHFQRGMIWWHPTAGVHAVMGPILDRWKSMRYERSRLGYPTSDQEASPDHRSRTQRFQGGSIYWSPQTGARVQ